jgi:GT2 family glycosyltransferase
MNNNHLYRETISSVPDDEIRPLWSVMIPTYNCAKYLRETLASVLAQDPGSELMQIEVIDDHSTQDDPETVVKELGQGRVTFYQHPENVGSIKNFNTCLQRSRGKLVHLLHGDDCVRQGFYQKLQQAFEQEPTIGLAFCRHVNFDEHSHWQWFAELHQAERGILPNWLEQIATINRIQPPSVVVRREVYEKLGGFDSRICCCAEDWELWVRIAANYPVWYEPEPLALYRFHSSSLTGRCARSGQNVRDLRTAIEITQSYLPDGLADQLTREARENWAMYAVKYIAPKMLNEGDIDAAFTQIQEVLKCSRSPKVIKAVSVLMKWFGKVWFKKKLKQVLP